MYVPSANGARRRPDKIWDTRHVSLARKFVFTPAEPQKSQPYSGERERNPELAGIGRFTTPTAGYLHWRGGFPPPTPSFRHAKNRGEFCEDESFYAVKHWSKILHTINRLSNFQR